MTKPTPSGYHRLEHELSREKRLTEASYALHTTLDLGEILDMILGAACDGVDADRGTVFVVSQDGTEIWSKVLRGEESLEIRLPLGRGIAGMVAQNGETIRLEDAYGDERFDRSWDEETGYRTRGVLCHPIRSREGAVVGVFQLLNKREGAFDEADERYLDALSMHASLALENARLHASALEKERQDREIRLVQEVQRAYQPEQSTLAVEGLEVAGLNVLCEDASGDYYDFIPIENGRYAIVIGDVSGHGLKSALIMAQARAFLRAYASTVSPLSSVLDRLDASLCHDMAAGRFMCLFVALVDPTGGALRWSNAGHPPPLLRRAGTGAIEELEPTGRVLGVLPDPSHREGEARTLEAGDVMLLYTDGATEACAPDGAMFGEERLRDLVAAAGDLCPNDLLGSVRDALRAWTGGDTLDDDLTLVALRKS
jgi:sigma-B regulation protein RsbU (phosphoserine phosphatase)